ncbi:LysM domain-containing protein [Paenibacillus sp. 32O-W]|uniref:LysM peptidoglycan-binding domain-containing protein n=1 Tax=Paenibacillus sp. 32O-W TaxID=1695218 RepID=UPI0007220AFF|nr:LysM domain-containing protein [Paenibacillus sp. 32O-W]ALS27198.1 LysM domain-containing protein [Paenibacillus sp. 32O-W]
MAKLGGHEIHVISENPIFEIDAPQYPVEKGIDLTDHVERRAVEMEITGKILGPKAASIRGQLVGAMNAGKLVNFTGRNAFKQALILSFSTEHDHEVANGYRFTAVIREVRIAEPSYPVLSNKATQSQAKSLTSAGKQQLGKQPPSGTPRYHTMRRGESMYSIAPKYGTSWQTILRLNPGVNPKSLQIGQKIRVA